jgi:RHS repeat-associated protein
MLVLLVTGISLYAQSPKLRTLTEKEVKQWNELSASKITPNKVAAQSAVANNTHVPNSITIDNTKAVGEIPFTSGVSASGAMTYNVPIEVYPGNHGIQPQIALEYNHLAGNGAVGVGWNVAGLSTISRTAKNLYYDEIAQGVRLDKNDAFVLDGMRLIKLSETTTQIKYETEQGNIKVNASISGNVVKYFTVLYPNGNTGTYGYTDNTVTKLSYPLTSFSDLLGNTISYNYDSVINGYRIWRITYNTDAVVQFQYQSRDDVVPAYEAGLEITENQRLWKIVCKFNNNTLRTYELSYQLQKGVSALTQIDCAANNDSLNPLKFYYGENNTDSVYINSEIPIVTFNSTDLKVVRGKFDLSSDNDGIIALPKRNSYWREKNSSLDKYINQYSVDQDIVLYAHLETGDVSSMHTYKTEAGFIDILCADIDGKPGDEVIKVNNVISGNNDQIKFSVYSKHISAGMIFKYTRTFNFSTLLTDNNGNKSVHPKYYYTGDFNGDGKMEVLAVSCHNPLGKSNTTKCYLFDLDSNTNTKLYEGYVFPYTVDFLGTLQSNAQTVANNTDKLYIMDYDGDGKDEICLINNDGVKIYSFTISGSTYSLAQAGSTYTTLKKMDVASRTLLLGELNGDGNPDFLLSPIATNNGINSTNRTWSIFYSMGNGQFTTKTCQSITNSDGAQFFLQDVNGDGLTDMIESYSSAFYTYTVSKGIIPPIADGNDSTTPKPFQSIMISTNIASHHDFNQLICLSNNGVITKFAYSRNDAKEKLLTGSVNSLGVVQKNYYKFLYETIEDFPATEIDEEATSVVEATFPYKKYAGALPVTVYTEQYVKGQKNDYKTYQYSGAILHKQGLGFCGFQQITTINKQNQTFIQEYDPFRYGVATFESTPTSSQTNTWSVVRQTNKTVKARLTNSTFQDLLKQTTITTSYIYDSYGSPTSETINYGEGITETNSITYYNNTSETNYLLGFLTDRTKTTNRNGTTFTERFYIPAHNNMGLANTVRSYVNGSQTSETQLVYNSQGNVTQKKEKSYSSTNFLTSNYTYDSYGRLATSADPLGFTTTYNYHPTKGNLSNTLNHKQQQTTYNTDALGRTTSVAYPDGSSENCSYTWANAGSIGAKGGVFATSNWGSAQPEITTYFDALGRELLKATTLFDGTGSNIEKRYDTYGRLQQVSLPNTITSGSYYWNTYRYDAYNRLTSVNYASGKIDSLSYSGKNVTSIIDGISSTKKFDAAGNLIEVEDAAGTVIYNLRPDGQPSSIVAPGNVTTSFTFDTYGRRTSISDPSAGTQTYTYDTAGNISSEKDANNKTITYSYDTYHRLTQKTQPEFTTTYAYNADGLPALESSGNGTSNIYTYDTYGRLSTQKETVPGGKYLQKSYAYSSGNVSAMAYSNQDGTIATENYTYANGYLTEMKLGTTSFWKLNSVNAFGQPTIVNTGVITRRYGFTPWGIIAGRSAETASGTFQYFSTSFNPATGNLTARQDFKYNKMENFTYDNLNRLTGYGNKTAAYDTKGNITGKNDVGIFDYGVPGKPYALLDIRPSQNAIPLRDQSITYTSFKRPATIAENNFTAAFTYNGREERVKMELKKNGAKELTRYYMADCYEIDDRTTGGLKQKLYLGGDFYSAPAVYVKDGTGNWNIYYICRDYLGSITHITNSSGSVVQELSYDAWGRLRNPANQTVYAPDSEPVLFLGRGYTGHEHLTQFGLINMNARLYDPAVGRFLAPDPYIQNPYFSQNFNRYSYALNNPLKYTDPSGEYCYTTDNPDEIARLWGYLQNGGAVPEPEDCFDGDGSGSSGSGFYFGDGWWEGDSGKYSYDSDTGYFDVKLPEVTVVGYSPDPFASPFGNHYNYLPVVYAGIDALDISNYAVSNAGTLVGGAQFAINSMSKAQQQHYAYEMQKAIKKQTGKRIPTKVIKKGADKALKGASKKITFVGAGLVAMDIYNDSELRASHLLNLGMVGVSMIPGVGWIAGGVYFAADMITLGVSGQSIGDHLDNAVGNTIINW